MLACMHVCVYGCVYIRMYACKYVYMHACHAYIHTYTHTVHTYTHTYTLVNVRSFIKLCGHFTLIIHLVY